MLAAMVACQGMEWWQEIWGLGAQPQNKTKSPLDGNFRGQTQLQHCDLCGRRPLSAKGVPLKFTCTWFYLSQSPHPPHTAPKKKKTKRKRIKKRLLFTNIKTQPSQSPQDGPRARLGAARRSPGGRPAPCPRPGPAAPRPRWTLAPRSARPWSSDQ